MKKSARFLVLMILLSLVSTLISETVELLPGTIIQLISNETLSSEYLISGQTVRFSTAYDVIVDHKVAISKSTEVLANVEYVEPNGIGGKPGSFILEIHNIKAVDGTNVPISVSKIVNGKGKQSESTIFTLVLCIFGIFIQGEEATLNIGTIIEATTTSDVDIETDIEFIQQEEYPAKVVKRDMEIEVITYQGKSIRGYLSSKDKGNIYIMSHNFNELSVINIYKIYKIFDVSNKADIKTKVFELADFQPIPKYKWNSVTVKEIK
jgi:hypothetical protein